MKPNKWTVVLHWFRKPEAILLTAALAGFLLVSAYYALAILPKVHASRLLDEELAASIRHKEAVRQQPIPAKATAQDIEELLLQVPTDVEAARFLMTLQELGVQTGVRIVNISFGEQNQPSPQSSLLPDVGEQTRQGNGQAASGGVKNGSFEEEKVSLTLQAPYSRAMDFLQRLQEAKRIVAIKDWTLDSGTGAGTNGKTIASPFVAEPSAMPAATATRSGEHDISLTLNMAVYVARPYADALKQLPAPTVEPGAQRSDPTWTDEMLFQLLKQKGP